MLERSHHTPRVCAASRRAGLFRFGLVSSGFDAMNAPQRNAVRLQSRGAKAPRQGGCSERAAVVWVSPIFLAETF